VARNLGYNYPQNAAAELDCMRTVPVADIENFVGRYQDAGTNPGISFGPVPDEITNMYRCWLWQRLRLVCRELGKPDAYRTIQNFAGPRRPSLVHAVVKVSRGGK
jgi:hypothetical protein